MTNDISPNPDLSSREMRRDLAIEKMNHLMAGIADEETHPVVRQRLIATICEATGYSFGCLSEVEVDSDQLKITAAYGSDKLISEAETLIGYTLIGRHSNYDYQRYHENEVVERFSDFSTAFNDLPSEVGQKLNHLVGLDEIVNIQLTVGNSFLGRVTFIGTKDNTQRDIDLLKTLCVGHLVYGLRLIQLNAWRMKMIQNYLEDLEEQVRNRTQALESSFRISRQLASIIHRDELMQAVVREVSQTFGYYHVQIYLVDNNSKKLMMMAGSGETGEILLRKKHALPLGKGLVGQAASQNEPILVSNVLEDPNWVANPLLPQTQSEMAVPISLSTKVLGVLDVQSDEIDGLNHRDLELIQSIADQVAVALRNAGVFSHLKQERDTLDEQMRETEEKAQASEARLERIVKTAMDGIIEIDKQGRVIRWNEMATQIFGWNASQIIGRTLTETIVPSSYRRSHERGLHFYRQTGNGPVLNRRIEIMALHKNGHEFPIELSITPIHVNDQVTFSGFVRDITERKRFENELTRAKEEAEAAATAKADFLANMSHEIRTPLNAIIGLTSLLLEMPNNPQQRDLLNTIRTSGDNLLTLLNDILDFSKIDAGKIDLEHEEFLLYSCIDDAFDQVASQASKKGIELGYFVQPAVPHLLIGDVTRIRQVLVNLINNAVKFTNEGEVMINVALEEKSEKSKQIKIRFDVRDTGIGIAKEHQQQLFQAFSQGDASTTRKYGGTGLGLAISKQLVELMGGKISVVSTQGEGSTFTFSVTLSYDPHHLQNDTGQHLTAVLHGKRALVIEDNETNRMLLEHHMRSWGMIPIICEHPDEAVHMVKAGTNYDVMVIDLQMAEMDGLELAQKIREYRSDEELPIIAISSMMQTIAETAVIPAENRLYKPLKPTTLQQTLVRRLGGSLVSKKNPTGRLNPDLPDLPQKLRILLAEDNAVNQKVVTNMLKHLGLRADLASNGIEAIRAVELQRYDVVLMDVQMPEMDGVLATQNIRKQFPAAYQPFIIALTANALVGDREKYLSAGMDDYISKPVKLHELRDALQRSIDHHQTSTLPQQRENEMEIFEKQQYTTARLQTPPIDLNALYEVIGMEDFSLAGELIDLYLDDSKGVLSDMKHHLETNDLIRLGQGAHTLKGSSASIGATRISQMAAAIEPLKKEHQVDHLPQRLTQLEEEILKLKVWWENESTRQEVA